MAGGLFALLDDVAALAKLAAASVDDIGAAAGRASAKAAGVVVDDTAVTPQFVAGVDPSRELPIIKKIATGSLRNKAIILVLALLLSQYADWALTPLLMVGGTYLAFEGAEKIWEKVSGHGGHDVPVALVGPEQERSLVSSAVRTDFILSAEIMVIALNEVIDESFWARAAILAVVGVFITVVVYGVVALIVKMDDAGLAMTRWTSAAAQRVGHAMVAGMPKLLAAIGVVGTVAMLWVGGHILLVGVDELGWHWLYDQVHHAEVWVHDHTGALGSVLGWITNTFFSAVVGLVVGAVVVALLHLVPRKSAAPAGTH